MSTPNVSDEMRQTAEYALKIAKERYGKQLDYSESSLPTLEYIIEQAHQQFVANKAEGKIANEPALNRTASVWGSYLGELIRKKIGGTWIIEESKRWMLVNKYKFSPIEYVYQRITGQLMVNVNQYFDAVVKTLSSQSINFVQPAPNLPISANTTNQSQTEPQKTILQPQKSNNKNKPFSIERILQIVLGVAVLFLIIWVVYSFIFPKIEPQNSSIVQPTQKSFYVQPTVTSIPRISTSDLSSICTQKSDLPIVPKK